MLIGSPSRNCLIGMYMQSDWPLQQDVATWLCLYIVVKVSGFQVHDFLSLLVFYVSSQWFTTTGSALDSRVLVKYYMYYIMWPNLTKGTTSWVMLWAYHIGSVLMCATIWYLKTENVSSVPSSPFSPGNFKQLILLGFIPLGLLNYVCC